MTTDRLFVIMLVMLIPMTGCFGAVDNADAQDDTVQNTSETIVNNYYNNTTTIMDTPVIEKFAAGGIVDWVSTADEYIPYNFSTASGEYVKIHYFAKNADSSYLRTVCDDGSTYSLSPSILDQGIGVFGSHTSCNHTVSLTHFGGSGATALYESGEWIISWNLVYSIESVTVV